MRPSSGRWSTSQCPARGYHVHTASKRRLGPNGVVIPSGSWLFGASRPTLKASNLMALVQAEGEAKVLTCLSGYLEFRRKELAGGG